MPYVFTEKRLNDIVCDAALYFKTGRTEKTSVKPAFAKRHKYEIRTRFTSDERLGEACLNAFSTARKKGCESFALCAEYGAEGAVSGAFADAVRAFLSENEAVVYISLCGKNNDLGGAYGDIRKLLEQNVFDAPVYASYSGTRADRKTDVCAARPSYVGELSGTQIKKNKKINADAEMSLCGSAAFPAEERLSFAEGEFSSQMEDNFALSLMKLIDEKGMDDVSCYKRANVSKQTWYKIMNEKNYRPSRNTAISFAIALRLDMEQTQQLLRTAGYALSRSSKADIIIEYYISHGIYDIFEIDEALFRFDQVPLCTVR